MDRHWEVSVMSADGRGEEQYHKFATLRQAADYYARIKWQYWARNRRIDIYEVNAAMPPPVWTKGELLGTYRDIAGEPQSVSLWETTIDGLPAYRWSTSDGVHGEPTRFAEEAIRAGRQYAEDSEVLAKMVDS